MSVLPFNHVLNSYVHTFKENKKDSPLLDKFIQYHIIQGNINFWWIVNNLSSTRSFFLI